MCCLLYSMLLLSENGTEELLNLQVSLSSLMAECVKPEMEEERKIIQPVIDHCLSECCAVAWAVKNVKKEAMKQNDMVSCENKTLIQEVNKMQIKKGINVCTYMYMHICTCSSCPC